MRENEPRRRLLAFAITLGAILAAYSNTLRNGFVWDDHTYVEGNPFVQDPANLRVLLDPRYYLGSQEVLVGERPVFLATLMADRALWGANPAGYHLTNVLLHAFDSLWVLALSTGLGLPPPLPLFSALLFGLHPIQTEAVNLVSFRSELLAAFFVFFSLWAYLRARRQTRLRRVAVWITASAALFGLGLLSKESAVTLPLLVLLLEIFFPEEKGRGPRLAAAFAAFLLVGCAWLGFWAPRFRYLGMGPSSGLRMSLDRLASAMPTAPRRDGLNLGLGKAAPHPPSPWEWSALRENRPAWNATMLASLAGYYRLFLLPAPLVADRAPKALPGLGAPKALLGIAVLLSVLAYAAAMRRRDPSSAFGAAWSLVALLPAANLIPLYIPVAERYAYLAASGAAWAGASAIAWLAGRRSPGARKAALAAGCGLCCVYALATLARNAQWRSDESLFLSGPEDAPRSSMARFNRGSVLRRRRRLDEAAREFREAVRLRPNYAEAWLGLGSTFAAMGAPERAAECYENALKIAPENHIMSFAYALFLAADGKSRRAVDLYKRSIELEPEFVESWLALGTLYRDMKRYGPARESLRRAAALAPGDPIPLYLLGTVEERAGDSAAALRLYRAALERNASFTPAAQAMGRLAAPRAR